MKHKNNKPLLRSSRMKAIGRERNFGSIREIIRENIELEDELIEYIFNKTFSDVNITDTDKKIILDFVTMTTMTTPLELSGFLRELQRVRVSELKKQIEDLKKIPPEFPPEFFQKIKQEYLNHIYELIDNFYLHVKNDINNIRIISDNSQKLIDDLIRNKYDEEYLNFIYSVVADKINFLLFANIVIQVPFNIQYLNQYLNIKL